MKLIADFHLHSRYSRAVSSKMDLEGLDEWSKIKGIDIISCADFTHPAWFKEIKEKLIPSEKGLFKLRGGKTNFILSTEISCIYSKNGKVRKIHLVIIAPSMEAVEKINEELAKIGNLKSDGRPILGLDAKEALKIVLGVSEDCLVMPAHVMTPWFGLFGSKSGFDSMEECFEDYAKYIYAIETGLSADPGMLLRIPDCRKVAILSNSDSHSLDKIGREANVFDCEKDYFSIIEKIKKRDLLYTIEFFPQEGKYFNDGHRDCEINLSPEESLQYGEICPVCGKPLTIGVMNRVQKLSRPGDTEKEIPFKSIIPLKEIIGEVLGVGSSSKAVEKEYNKLINAFDSEFNILLDVPESDLLKEADEMVVRGIIKTRKGEVNIVPGFDGEYGKIGIFSEKEKKDNIKQKTLF